MEIINQDKNRTYKTKEIADMVQIAPSTIRKYAQMLENAGHDFMKDSSHNRLFTIRDATIFENIKSIRDMTGVGLEQAINAALKGAQNKSPAIPSEINAIISAQNERYEKMNEKIEQQAEQIKGLTDLIREKEDQRDKQLLEILHTLQEKRSKKWWQFWK